MNTTRSPRGSWNAATATSRPPSCPSIARRTFASPADFNTQLGDWLTKANTRMVRTTRARPVDLLEVDRAGMLPLPPVPPVVGWVNRVRLGRDYYVRVDCSDYSVDPGVIGRFVDVRADLDRVTVTHEGRLVAAHDRVWARGRTVTDPPYVAAAKALRERYQRPRAAEPRDSVGSVDELARDLAEYDRAFGLLDTGLLDTGDGQVA